METIYIYNGASRISVPVTDSAERSHSLQQHNYVKLVWKSAENTPISANAYIEYEGQVFYALDDYFPTHKDGIYEYDIEFHAIEDTFNRPLFFRHVDILDQATGETTSWKEIEWSLNGNLRTIAQIVVESLNRAYDNAYFALPNDSYADTLLLSYSFASNSIADALSTIAEQNETEWWLETTDEYVNGKRKYILHFDKCELGDTIELNDNYTEDANGVWQSGGLKSVSQSGNTNTIPQKLYVYGSERNIIKKTVEQEVAGGAMNVSYDKKLRLPKRLANNTNLYYLESVGILLTLNEDSSITISGINNKFEQVKIFDEVYPKMNMTVKGVSVQNPNSENPIYWLKGDRLKSITTENPADDSINPGKLGLLIEGCTLMCTFTSGLLNGREFECSWRESTAEIGLIPIDENDVQIPSGVFKPQEGDTFILWNLAMPQSSIDIAQKELLTEAINYIEELVTSITETDCTTEAEATRISGLNTKIKVGQRISVNSNVFRNGRLSSRIINFSYKLTKPYDISFTLASSRQTGRLATLQNLIADVTHEVHSVGQVQRAISRRQWHDTEEMMQMLDSIQKQMVVVGDENNSFTTTCVVDYNNNTQELYISFGYLQHQSYTDNEWKGAWLIEQSKTISMPALDEKGVTPFYVYFVCSKDNNTGYAEIGSALPQYNDNYVFVLGILSSEFEGERIFNQSSGLTSIAGGTITTDVVQDPGRRLIIDYSNAIIIARNGATIKGAIQFEKGEGENDLGSALEGLLNGVDNLQKQVDGEKTAWFLEGEPEPNTEPAVDWITEEEKQRHEGDTYTNINSSGKVLNILDEDFWEQGTIVVPSTIGKTYSEIKAYSEKRIRTKKILPTDLGRISSNNSWEFCVTYYDENKNVVVNDFIFSPAIDIDISYNYFSLIAKRLNEVVTPEQVSDFTLEGDVKYFEYEDTTAGQSWRWCKCTYINEGGTEVTGWHWHKIADSDAVKALKEAGEAQQKADKAQTDATNAQNRMNNWASDSNFSKLEQQGLEDEKRRIEADKSDIDKECEKYILTSDTTYTEYVTAYNTIIGQLNSVVTSLNTNDYIAIPQNFSTNHQTYYNKRTLVLERISDRADEVANDYADKKVGEIEVGGRNLLKNSKEIIAKSVYKVVDVLQNNTNYVISCKNIVKSANSEYTRVVLQIPNGAYKRLVNEWDGTPIKFNTEGGYTILYLYGGNPSISAQSSTFYNIKLEEGNKATSWTPAPEDVDAEIADTMNAIETLNDDSIFQQSEKLTIRKEWEEISGTAVTPSDTADVSTTYGDNGSYKKTLALIPSGSGISTTTIESKIEALRSYLNTYKLYRNSKKFLRVGETDPAVVSGFSRSTLAQHFQAYYNEESNIIKAINDYFAKKQVQDLKIGGTNILLNSKINSLKNWKNSRGTLSLQDNILTCTATGSWNRIFNPQFKGYDFNVGDEYTISLDIKTNDAKTRRIAICNDSFSIVILNFGDVPTSQEWTRVTRTAKVAAGDVNYATMGLYIFASNWNNYVAGDYVQVRNIQLEKGNKATAWKPNDADRIEARENILKDAMMVTLNEFSCTSITLTNNIKANTEYVFSIENVILNQNDSNSAKVEIYETINGKEDGLDPLYTFDVTPNTKVAQVVVFSQAMSALYLATDYLTAQFIGVKLAEGNVYTGWQGTQEEQQTLMALSSAMKGTTDIIGGLVLTNLIQLKNESGQVTAGITGLTTSNDSGQGNLFAWAGGTMDQAIAGNTPVLLKRNGTGSKIGCFIVEDNDKIKVTTANGYVLIDADGGVSLHKSDGIETVRIKPDDVSEDDLPTTTTLGSFAYNATLATRSNTSTYSTAEYTLGSYSCQESGEYVIHLENSNKQGIKVTASVSGTYMGILGGTSVYAEVYSELCLKEGSNYTVLDFRYSGSNLSEAGSVSLSATYTTDNAWKIRYKVQLVKGKTYSLVYRCRCNRIGQINGYITNATLTLKASSSSGTIKNMLLKQSSKTIIGNNGIMVAQNMLSYFFANIYGVDDIDVRMVGLPISATEEGQLYNNGDGIIRIKQ